MIPLLALSLACGIFCAALWDVFRIPTGVVDLFMPKVHNSIRVLVAFFRDLTFCVFCGCLFSIVLYYGNSGKFRGLALVGLALGFVAYRVTFGRLVTEISKKISVSVRHFLMWVFEKFEILINKLILKLKKTVKAVKDTDNQKKRNKIERNQNCRFVSNKKHS